MSACAMLTYNNITNDAWNTIKSWVGQHGVNISDYSGNCSMSGFTLHWSYDPAKQVLSVQCTHHPIFISCAVVQSQITDHIEKCLTQHNVVMTPLVAVAS